MVLTHIHSKNNQWNLIEDPYINPQKWGYLIFYKEARTAHGMKDMSSTNGSSQTGWLHVEESK